MKKLNLVLAGIGSAALVSYGVVAQAATVTTPLNWTAGTATVDGNTADWNLSTDASTIMCEAGSIANNGTSCDGKDHLSTVYTRYNCDTDTMYVLVLKQPGHTADNGQSWVKVYDLGNSAINFSGFSAVNSGGQVQGYEASFSLAAGHYNNAQVHITIDSSKTSSTGKSGGNKEHLRSIDVPATCSMPVVVVDTDKDTIPDSTDNCPAVANTNQADADKDGMGDACESDTDKDSVIDDSDNCPAIANTNQADADKDGMGDACESDTDKDGVIDDSDNCPAIANTNQADADKDGMGDACESDTDKDGVIDDSDNCPVDMNANQADVDSDGKGDACDDKDDRPVVTPPTDTDEDGVPDDSDNCPSKPNADQADTNGDGKGDACEVTYGDSKASVVGIWKYVGSMSVQDFDATYKEGTDYVFTGDDSGDYLLQGIDDEGKTTSMSGAKMK